MFGSLNSGANAYSKVAVETGVVTASPHQLIVMLFDGALVAVSTAASHMKSGNIPEKGKAISKAISIIDSGLRASLNKETGGSIAANLDALYAYMSNKLLLANVNNQPKMLDEVQELLNELKEAWIAIGKSPASPAPATIAPAAVAPAVAANDVLTSQSARLVKAYTI